jgi:hypothetical protein
MKSRRYGVPALDALMNSMEAMPVQVRQDSKSGIYGLVRISLFTGNNFNVIPISGIPGSVNGTMYVCT